MPACGTAAMAADADAAVADDAPTPGARRPTDSLGDIVVTARKRKESALDVPVALSALSQEDLAKLNVKTIEDLVQVTPGVVINNATTGAARSDRSKSAVIIRGMAPTVGNQTTSIFVNGVTIADGAVTGIFDLERSEVLKGPQSAYFGRQTFAGAVNLITAAPTDYWRGYVSGTGASGNYFDMNGAIGGPIIPNLLSFRASARYYTREGTWKNEAEPGNTLGDQSTRSASLTLKFTPTETLTITGFVAGANDHDGLGPTGVIDTSQSNCTLPAGATYFCGTLPGLLPGNPSAMTQVTAGIQDMQENYTSLLPQSQTAHTFGLKRMTRHFHAAIDWEMPGGQTVSSLTGWNKNHWSTLYPLNGRASTYEAVNTGYPFLPMTDWPISIERKQNDFSQELRIASGQDQAFRWLVGGSYLYQKQHERFAQLYYLTGLYGGDSGIAESKTVGGFLGLQYDVTSTLTINADARYQSDKLISRDGITNEIGYQKSYSSFMPRASIQYKPNPDTMVYATYSKGVNPGLGRDPLLSVPESQRPVLEAMGITHGVQPETLDNFEVGFKGKLFDGKLVISGDIYYDIWTDKITETTLLIPQPNAVPLQVLLYTNLGKAVLKGVELDATAQPIDNLVIRLAGALNDSKIEYGSCSICETQTGSDNADGNQLGLTSRWSAQGSVEYTQPTGWKDFTAFIRPDFFYKSGMYESDGNYAKSKPQFVVNFRGGVRSDNMTIEAFMTNAFNNKAYTSLLPDWQLDNPAENFAHYNTVYVGLPPLRTYGLKVTYSF
jgi:iron complex outermembrane receptor protein